MIIAFAGATYCLWEGVVNGLIRRKVSDPERPEGWSGPEAVLVGLWIVLIGLAAAAVGVGAAVNIVQGGGDTVRIDSLPMVFLGLVAPAFGCLAGLPLIALGVRTGSARYAVVGSFFVVLCLGALLGMAVRLRG